MAALRDDSLPRIAVLVSGSGTNLQAILDAVAAGNLAAQVVVVVSNRDGVGALARAQNAGVPDRVLTPAVDEERSAYDGRLADLVEGYDPDIVVLAGWMRILSNAFLERFPGRVINLHPALPGELPGLHAIERAWHEMMAGERTHTGVMVHLVPDEGVDDGPVLASTRVEIRMDDTIDTLTARVHDAEHSLLVDTLSTILTDLTERT